MFTNVTFKKVGSNCAIFNELWKIDLTNSIAFMFAK